MKLLRCVGIFLGLVAGCLRAEVTTESLRLWPGDAPGVLADVGPEKSMAGGRVAHVSVPMLDVYLPPPDQANGAAIIIVSGGGYGVLASGPLGQKAAKVFGPHGYSVFSVKYRTNGTSENVLAAAVADGRRAVRLVRSRAAEWGIDPHRIGLVGFSAGSNLILNLVTSATEGDPASIDPVAQLSCRPDFIGLAATWPYNQKITAFTIHGAVPPLFILHARDDRTARLSFTEEVVAGWRAAGVPVEYHELATGGHMAFNGFRDWPSQLMDWLGRGMVPAVGP